ncbi:hypothetical protein [Aestuariibaculum sediminum]|uniref:Uncharacterized protein n=1 Tax=Aestuariibaculum sediminum TaxID=2770637 RepID=A0A8J6Q3F3_9FLAO|nr:hypothetical protein [Aestuariibaculum sediminum]MBD0833554.1 hypothetical protein [Aestuariibaculum sediminum]
MENPFKNINTNIFNVPKYEMPQINPEAFADLRDPDEVTRQILGFLTTQGENAEKQFKTSRNLIIATIVIMILQIGYAVWTNSESNSRQYNLTKIIDMQSQQSEVISRMSLNLLDLENQVRTLEQENAQLNQELNK